jgi:uncharacterized membrane protein
MGLATGLTGAARFATNAVKAAPMDLKKSVLMSALPAGIEAAQTYQNTGDIVGSAGVGLGTLGVGVAGAGLAGRYGKDIAKVLGKDPGVVTNALQYGATELAAPVAGIAMSNYVAEQASMGHNRNARTRSITPYSIFMAGDQADREIRAAQELYGLYQNF